MSHQTVTPYQAAIRICDLFELADPPRMTEDTLTAALNQITTVLNQIFVRSPLIIATTQMKNLGLRNKLQPGGGELVEQPRIILSEKISLHRNVWLELLIGDNYTGIDINFQY